MYVSVTTGTRVGAALRAAFATDAGTGATTGAACNVGTESRAKERYGSFKAGSAETVVAGPGVRNAATSGPT